VQSTKVELVLNLETANALGLKRNVGAVLAIKTTRWASMFRATRPEAA
jgi:hypothetical protein